MRAAQPNNPNVSIAYPWPNAVGGAGNHLRLFQVPMDKHDMIRAHIHNAAGDPLLST